MGVRFCSPSVGLVVVLFLTLWSSELASSESSREIEDSSSAPIDYSGFKVIRVRPETDLQKSTVNRYFDETKDRGVTLWTESRRLDENIDLLVAKKALRVFFQRLRRCKLSHEILIEDLQKLIDEQKRESDEHRRLNEGEEIRLRRSVLSSNNDPIQSDPNGPGTVERNNSAELNDTSVTPSSPGAGTPDRNTSARLSDITNRYATSNEINNWLKLVARTYPNISEVIQIGRSYQGRPLNVIKIGGPKNTTKPAVWMDAGIHAREWISPATAVYIINALVTGYKHDAVVTDLLEEFDWYVMPSVNPDGYDYSHTTDRLWRKTRSRVSTPRRNCSGVDANRNFDFRWQSECEGNVRCRGRLPCSDVFAGFRPLSEPETIAVANFILTHRNTIKMYLSFHSYSQLFLLPWGYTKEHPSDYDDLKRLSEKAVVALKTFYNTSYSIGTPGEILYQATGGSFDWAKGVAGIKYSFTMELRDTGRYGFLLPAHQIQPTGQETWAGVKKLVIELKLDTCWMSRTNC